MLIATDPLSLVFIFCFLLGFGFFLAASLLGGHGHSHAGHVHVHVPTLHHVPPVHSGAVGAHAPAHAPATPGNGNGQQTVQQTHFSLEGYLNPTSIALFLLGFGFFGYFFHNLTPLAASLSLLLAILGSLVLTIFLLSLLGRLFANVESSSEPDVVDRTGMLGKVSITIPEKGLGEILYTSPGGMRKSIPARGINNQRLERDAEVVVVNYQQGVAEVDTWEHFMHGETNFADPATPAELEQFRTQLAQADSDELHIFMHQEQRME